MHKQARLNALRRTLGLTKQAEEFGAHVGQLLAPGFGTAIGGYMGSGSEDEKLRRALYSAGGGVSGLVPGAVLGGIGLDPHVAYLLSRAGGHLGTHLGYRHGNKPSE